VVGIVEGAIVAGAGDRDAAGVAAEEGGGRGKHMEWCWDYWLLEEEGMAGMEGYSCCRGENGKGYYTPAIAKGRTGQPQTRGKGLVKTNHD